MVKEQFEQNIHVRRITIIMVSNEAAMKSAS